MSRSRRKYDPFVQPGLFDDDFMSVEEPATSFNDLFESKPIIRERLKFISLGSGSSGNSSFLGNEDYGFLIDAGVKHDLIIKELLRNGIDMFKVIGIILTHDHTDHIAYAYRLLRSYPHMALFCTPRILNGILRRHNISRRIKDYHHPVYKETPFHIKDFEITAFEVSHDGSDNVGYLINWKKHRFVVATDMGYISERAQYYMSQATALMLESDYDHDMLVNGRYPEYLKARIMAEKGHLSNTQVFDFLSTHWNSTLTHVFLCHLSQHNNNPSIALASAREALIKAGASSVGDASESIESRNAPVQLSVLPRFDSSQLFIIK